LVWWGAVWQVSGGRGWNADFNSGSIVAYSSEVDSMKGKMWSPVVMAAGVVASNATASASNVKPLPCLADMRAALVQGHFTGPILCSRKDAAFVLVGRTKGNKFSIYDYRYRFLPAGGNVMHGGQKMVVFRNNVYAGHYSLSPPPYTTITVNGGYASLKTDGQSGIELNLKRKPPRRFLFNGEVVTFSR
jgi:hypothetical protein